MDQYIGKLLDNRYEILECIGTGGMAVVYKARCHRLNRLVAVKILKPELARDAEFRRRFHDESQAVAMLSHPNIVAVYDVSHTDELDYIVMELIDGITLKQYMQKKGMPLNWREALHFITQIVKGLSHAHSRGIIHRDIKPHNVMVLRDGSVKVADFGIARLASASQSTLTQETLGSVHYISPEQARGSHIDCRTDIYSAGVVLYEMTAGRLPYEGDTPVSVAIQHINSIPLPTRDINPDIPEALEAITMKAMASNVDKRYASADAMLADLEEFRKNPSIDFDYTEEDLFQGGGEDEPTIIRTVDSSSSRREENNLAAREESTRETRKKSGRDEKERKNPWPIVLAVLAILVFFGGIAYFLCNTLFSGILGDSSKEVVVPNLLGRTIAEVNEAIASGEIDSVFTIVQGDVVESDMPAGQIVYQDPAFNETRKGEKITITVDISAGPAELVMPNVVGKDYRVAQETLSGTYGVDVALLMEYSDDVDANLVISTDPVAGTELEEGQKVTIVVSQGPKTNLITVISFVGMDIEEARATANAMGLFVDDIQTKVDDAEKGTVIYQSIQPEAAVEEGTSITFYTSSGPTEDNGDENEEGEGEDDTTVPTSKSVTVELSSYTETVHIVIEVDGIEKVNTYVDPSSIGTFTTSVQGTGSLPITVYVNDVVVQNYIQDFSE